MDRVQFIDRLYFHNDFAFDPEVQSVTRIQGHFFVLQRQWMLMEDRERQTAEFEDQAMHVCAFQEAQPERSMHFEGSIQNVRRYTVLFYHPWRNLGVRGAVAVKH